VRRFVRHKIRSSLFDCNWILIDGVVGDK
jgi:hypothetical protein